MACYDPSVRHGSQDTRLFFARHIRVTDRMTPRRIVVCEAQVPFVEGGAEYHVRELVRQLRAHGFQTELVSIPFKWYPKDEILAHAAAWRLIDLSDLLLGVARAFRSA